MSGYNGYNDQRVERIFPEWLVCVVVFVRTSQRLVYLWFLRPSVVSVNRLRSPGWLFDNLHAESALEDINLSWNQLGVEGALAVAEALERNTRVRAIDVG
eukprot:EG_transcript_52485